MADPSILAFDLGASLGWATWRPGKRTKLAWGQEKLAGGGPRHKVCDLWERLQLQRWEFVRIANTVAYETPIPMAGRRGASDAIRYETALWLALHDRAIPPRLMNVHPSTLKKHIAGSGRAKKHEVRAAVEDLWGVRVQPGQTDAADALAVLWLAREELRGE